MTASIQPESKSPSRRALLAGALGGIGALAATVIGRASPVRAADDDAMLVGGEYTATTVTKITNASNGNDVLSGQSDGTGTGVRGVSALGYGIRGVSTSGTGVSGFSFGDQGVDGASTSGIGVRGTSDSGAGMLGTSGTNAGVYGFSGTQPLTLNGSTGVYGYANQSIFASGVTGQSPLGVGVRGKTTSGYAGYFEGRVYTNRWYELAEVANPAPPLANRARLFVRDNGAGKTQLCVRFRTGGVHIIKTEA